MPPHTPRRGNTHSQNIPRHTYTHNYYSMTCLLHLLAGTDEKPHQTQRELCFARVGLFQELSLLKLGIWQKKDTYSKAQSFLNFFSPLS